jgi:hypothetical protein
MSRWTAAVVAIDATPNSHHVKFPCTVVNVLFKTYCPAAATVEPVVCVGKPADMILNTFDAPWSAFWVFAAAALELPIPSAHLLFR